MSLGHLGWRTDWTLLRAVAERMPELVLLLVGAWHEDECAKDPDFAWCRSAPGLVWLGRRSDDEAARLILCADVGILPFRVEPFNDAALPYRILKYARLGRRTVSPELAGVHTWDRAVTTVADADAFVAALRAQAGARCGRTWSCAPGRSSRPPSASTRRCGSACASSALALSTRSARQARLGPGRARAVHDEVAAADEREREQAADERDDGRDEQDVVERRGEGARRSRSRCAGGPPAARRR